MTQPRLGIVLDSFHQPVKSALRSASALAFREIEMPVVGNEVDPAQLSRSGRRQLAHIIHGYGLQLDALGADLGGGRFSDSSSMEMCLDKTRAVMEMAAELQVPVVTSRLGRVDEAALARGHLREALSVLAEVADRTGTRLAFDTAGAEPENLHKLLQAVSSPSVGVCFDPASLLIEGFDPMRDADTLAEHLQIARVRDAVAGLTDRPGRETPIGQGQVDFAEYLAWLDQAGYRRVPMIHRTGAANPRDEIAHAKAYLESLIR